MQFNLPLMGARFRSEEVKKALRSATPGDVVTLEPEPENEYDPFAIRVILKEQHIGFLPHRHYLPRVINRGNQELFDYLAEGNNLSAKIISSGTPTKPLIQINL